MAVLVRLAISRDLEVINAIYNHYVGTSTCTFQLSAETLESRRAWFESRSHLHPVLVAELNAEVVGWASLSPHKLREAYRHTVESSVYIHPDHHRRGIGRALMEEAIRVAHELGHHTILAGVSDHQVASVKLHELLGFIHVAAFRELGFKFDRWIDVDYLQLVL